MTTKLEQRPGLALGPTIRSGLSGVRVRARLALFLRGFASVILILVGLSLISFTLDRTLRLSWIVRLGVMASAFTALAVAAYHRLIEPLLSPLPDVELARAVEALDPALDWRLLSAVEFCDPAWEPRRETSIELAGLVVADAERLAKNVRFGDAVPGAPMGRNALRGGTILVCALALAIGFSETFSIWFQRNVLLSASAAWPQDTFLTVLDPRDETKTLAADDQLNPVRVILGENLSIVVQATGEVPSRVVMETRGRDGSEERLVLDGVGEGRFRALLEDLQESFEFTLEGGDASAGPFYVEVLRRPWIEDLTFVIEPPAYTGQARQEFGVEAGSVSLPLGTQVELTCTVSKDLAKAWMIERVVGDTRPQPESLEAVVVARPRDVDDVLALSGGRRLSYRGLDSVDETDVHAFDYFDEFGALAATFFVTEEGRLVQVERRALLGATKGTFVVSLSLDQTRTFDLKVQDMDGLGFDQPTRFSLVAKADQPPDVQMTLSGVGLNVTPQATLAYTIGAKDEYGLQAGALRYRSQGGEAEEHLDARVPLDGLVGQSPTLGRAKLKGEAVGALNLEQLALVPGMSLGVWAEASDHSPQGPNLGTSPVYQLRIVTPEFLLNDLLRRLHEQRVKLEQVIAEEERLGQGLRGLDETTLERTPRTQRDVARTLLRAADVVDQVVEEMVANKVLEKSTWDRLREGVAESLRELEADQLRLATDLAELAQGQVGTERHQRMTQAGGAAELVEDELRLIVARMGRIEELGELVSALKELIREQQELLDQTRHELQGERERRRRE